MHGCLARVPTGGTPVPHMGSLRHSKSVYKKGFLTLWHRPLACVFTAETAVPQVGTALFRHPLSQRPSCR